MTWESTRESPTRRTGARRKGRARTVRRLTVGLLFLGAAVVAAWLARPLDDRSGLRVSIVGRTERLPPHSTLAQAAARFGLRPRSGDLLDVEGVPLEQAVYPGRLLVNGRALRPTSELHGGDRVAVADGRDRFEPRV